MPSDPPFIPLCVPHLAGNEWVYIKECLDTGWVSSVGSYVTRFEQEFAAAVGTRFAVACSNGTTALHTALMAAGVKPGDRVLVPTLTFIASANAISHAGAVPLFMDVDEKTWQLDPCSVERFLTDECETAGGQTVERVSGRRVAAIMPVHILGIPCDMAPLSSLAERHGLKVVEDATESLGATWNGRPIGSIGDCGVFSFNGNKLITTGGGGMLCTNIEALAKRAKHLTTTAKIEPVEFIHDEVGYNYRLVNVLAAMGVAQLEQLPTFLAKKAEIADWYDELLAGLPVEPMPEPEYGVGAKWLYTIRMRGRHWRPVCTFLEAAGIQTRPLWQCLHRSPAYSHLAPRDCPVADQLQRECLSLPCSVGLTRADAERVAAQLEAALNQVE